MQVHGAEAKRVPAREDHEIVHQGGDAVGFANDQLRRLGVLIAIALAQSLLAGPVWPVYQRWLAGRWPERLDVGGLKVGDQVILSDMTQYAAVDRVRIK